MEEKGLTPDGVQSVEDLHKLPFLTKDDLRDAYPYRPRAHAGTVPHADAAYQDCPRADEAAVPYLGRPAIHLADGHLPAGPWRGVPDRPQLRGRPGRAPAPVAAGAPGTLCRWRRTGKCISHGARGAGRARRRSARPARCSRPAYGPCG